VVKNELTGQAEWRFTGFYGEPIRARRKHNWDLLKYMSEGNIGGCLSLDGCLSLE
jgi:hypothetical protein